MAFTTALGSGAIAANTTTSAERVFPTSTSSGATLTDSSSGASLSGLITEAPGNTYRGIGSSWFNARNVASEDWARSEAAAYNAYLRNASEAQKVRDWEERMANTAYQRAVADMKKAGINPVLAYSQGGAATPSAPAATSGHGYSGSSPRDPLSSLLRVAAGLIATVITRSPRAGKAFSDMIVHYNDEGWMTGYTQRDRFYK